MGVVQVCLAVPTPLPLGMVQPCLSPPPGALALRACLVHPSVSLGRYDHLVAAKDFAFFVVCVSVSVCVLS